MSDDKDAKTEIPSSVRDFAEKSVEQARSAVGTLLDAARKTAESIQTSAKTADTPPGQAVSRGFGFAEQNISAIFDFARKLVRAPDLKEATRLQVDFVREQAAIMEKQVAELKDLTPPKT
ncbi:phasin family protein [Enterovirga aerilata]|uniref:Phasin n=1 Tax=Enterovirga aerilata TaxID=2730920 RepID=A0A849IC26_9HYPH|nr:phasin family protein [Enterovirga sp. DB1703]NNM71483.1 phasin [Enterovirga sp. DB1703]